MISRYCSCSPPLPAAAAAAPAAAAGSGTTVRPGSECIKLPSPKTAAALSSGICAVINPANKSDAPSSNAALEISGWLSASFPRHMYIHLTRSMLPDEVVSTGRRARSHLSRTWGWCTHKSDNVLNAILVQYTSSTGLDHKNGQACCATRRSGLTDGGAVHVNWHKVPQSQVIQMQNDMADDLTGCLMLRVQL
eukprot:GHUV01046247.1.p1 GENE.GHUV01046247.1~~GHUV01046247.1.p1  ORF type:complete len:193 (+),score=28.57 GHUV01046247.1:91-669(+)